MTKIFLEALRGKTLPRPPFWLMRQAGRYLPEYRDVRARAGSFLDLVYAPHLAAEVTLQPLRRFGMDAAILFSDILVVPHALGQHVRFEEGEGPRLEPVCADRLPVFNAEAFLKGSAPVFETVATIRRMMQTEGFDQTALIGFAGSPWTVACYMVEGGSSREFLKTRQWAIKDPIGFSKLMDVVGEATVAYLSAQVEAGAEALQLFDSWAGILDQDGFERWVVSPTVKIVRALSRRYPDIPVIGFPRGAGVLAKSYAEKTGITAISVDQGLPVSWVAATLQSHLAVQGNLDPVRLLAGGKALDEGIDQIMGALSKKPFVFNLGHGIHKDTPPAHVAQLAKRIRG